MNTLEISRSRWGRGCGHGEGWLKSAKDGKMCCLGFACKALGFSDAEILGQRTPSNLVSTAPISEQPTLVSRLNPLLLENGFAAPPLGNLIADNDDAFISEKDREKKIRAGFKKLGIKVKFTK